MKIWLWGSAANERIPAMFCKCGACELARQRGGKYIRTQAQALVDDHLLIDFGQDTFHHSLTYDYDFTRLRDILITHAHPDHLAHRELENTWSYYAHNDMDTIHVHGGEECGELIATLATKKVDFILIAPFETQRIGDYTVTALPAEHGTRTPLCYIVSDGMKTILYNHDTRLYQNRAVYEFIRSRGFCFDAVICDGTGCLQSIRHGSRHMTLYHNLLLRGRLSSLGALSEGCVWVVTHFSHNGLRHADGRAATQEELDAIAARENIVFGYDGLTLTL